MKMDLSKFRVHSSDDKSTTLLHPRGHKIVIAHKALSSELKDQLESLPRTKPKKMAEGGKVPGGNGSPAIDQKKAKELQDGSQESGWQPKQWMANIKSAAGYADGGGVSAPPSEEDQIVQDAQNAPVRPEYEAALAKETANSNPQIDAVYGTPEQRAQQDVDKVDSQSADHAAYEAQQSKIQDLVNANRMQQGQAPVQLSGAAATPEAPAAKPITDVSAGVSQAAPSAPKTSQDPMAGYMGGQQQYLTNVKQGIGEQIGGKYAEAAAIGKEGQQEAKALHDASDMFQHIQNTGAQHLQAVTDEINNVTQDIKDGHIDPNHYLASQSTLGRISTGIGLLLGGFGAGLSKGPNQAVEFLNKQIDRDIEAQKAEMGKKENLLSAYQRQYGNINDATKMAMATQGKLLENQLLEAADTAKDPIAKARAVQAAGEIHEKYAQLPVQVAKNQALIQLTGGAQGNPQHGTQLLNVLRVSDPQAATELSKRAVPDGKGGTEFAQVEVPQSVRDNLESKQALHQAASDLYDFVKNKGSSLSLQDRAVAEQKALVVQSLYREGLLKTVYKQGEQPLLDKTVNEQPLSLVNKLTGTGLPKLNEVIQSNRRGIDTLRGSVGLPVAAPIKFTPRQ